MAPFEDLMDMWVNRRVVDRLEHQGREHGLQQEPKTRRTDLFERNGIASGHEAISENGVGGSIFTVCAKPK